MEIIGFTNEEITSVFQVVASILKLGNVDFDHKTNKNGTDSCMVKNDKGLLVFQDITIFQTIWLLTGINIGHHFLAHIAVL
jgi:hypothetical protein